MGAGLRRACAGFFAASALCRAHAAPRRLRSDYHHPRAPGGRRAARHPLTPPVARPGTGEPASLPRSIFSSDAEPCIRRATNRNDHEHAFDHAPRRFGPRGSARARRRPTSPRRSGRASPRRRWRRGSMASCATSAGRSRATATSLWSRRATRPMRSSWPGTILPMSSPRRCRTSFPGTQITFGPSTDDGFYYDFAPDRRARPLHRGGSAGHRGGDAAHHPRRRAAGARGLVARRNCSALARAGRDVQGRMGDRAARGRGAHGLPVGRRLARHVPRPAPRLDRQARSATPSS